MKYFCKNDNSDEFIEIPCIETETTQSGYGITKIVLNVESGKLGETPRYERIGDTNEFTEKSDMIILNAKNKE